MRLLRLLSVVLVAVLQTTISVGQLQDFTLWQQGIDNLDYYDPRWHNRNGTRIVGGRPIHISRVPWQVVIFRNDRFICGGSLISVDWVLTAAHCVADGGRFGVRAGSSFRKRGGQFRRARVVVMSATFNTNTYDFDIAMIRVRTKFRLNRNVKPVALAKLRRELPERLFVSGWGSLQYNGRNPRRIRGVTLRKFDRTQCIRRYQSSGFTVTRNMICAGGQGRDVCQGDSGGPLVRRSIQYGIVSLGLQCSGTAAIYTNIRRMNGWIRRAVKRRGGEMPTFK